MFYQKLQKNNKVYPNHKMRRGVALLFTIIIVSILFAITSSIVNISVKEISFSISGKDANDAFFAADTGIECALFYDKTSATVFANPPTFLDSMNCADSNDISVTSSEGQYDFTIQMGNSCARVTVTKTLNANGGFDTNIISKGYNRLNSSGACAPGNGVTERELEVDY